MSQDTDRATYPELLNFFYDCGFPSILRGNANSVAHAIMQKWNRLIRPESFSMSNAELSSMSGVTSHIERSRQKVLDRCKIDRTPLFIYIPGTTRMAGKYKINSTLLPLYSHFNAYMSLMPNAEKGDQTPTNKGQDANGTELALGLKKRKEKILDGFGADAQKKEFNKASKRLSTYDVNARKELLEYYEPEWINLMIDQSELSYPDNPTDLESMAGLIVSKVRDAKCYKMWQKGKKYG